MISPKNIMIGLLGTAVLACSSPAMSGKWTLALEDEEETRSTLLLKCQEGLKNTAKKETREEEEKWALWGQRLKALINGKQERDPLPKEERDNLKLLKKEKISLTSTSDTKERDLDSNTTMVTLTTPLPSTTSESSEKEMRQQLERLRLLKELEQAKRELAEEKEKRQEVENRLSPILEEEKSDPDSSEPLIFGRTPDRVEHNVNTEVQRGVETLLNGLSGKGWKHNKKLLKKKRKKHK